MTNTFRRLVLFFAMAAAAPAQAQDAAEPARETLYLVTTLRAAPGELGHVIDDVKRLKADGFYESAGRTAPLVIRHSQGDHWDLMLLEPIGSYADFFDPFRMSTQKAAFDSFGPTFGSMAQRVAFAEDLFAYGPSPEVLDEHAGGAGLFHVEMFHALPGKRGDLIAQREMENAYYKATARKGNLVFVGDMGSDVDVFTVGAYDDLSAFAADPELDDAALEQAAREAGFTARDDIGLYLRSLISQHHDTLATPVN